MRYVLDTNIFNRVLDGRFALSALPVGSEFVATLVQFKELEKTSDPVRRAALLATFQTIAPELAAASFSLDIAGAGLDEGILSDNNCARTLKAALDLLEPKFNNWHDALIAEVAVTNGYELITADANLAIVAAQYGVTVREV